jgi:hypothetical protein
MCVNYIDAIPDIYDKLFGTFWELKAIKDNANNVVVEELKQ